MRKVEKILWAIFFLLPLLILNSGSASANPIEGEDETPDVTARVARISFLRGAAQIRHSGSRDWERATQNLPLVEGDEISTERDARLEIQFNRDNYLRLSENARLKIETLRDEGIAVSLPEGNLSLRVLNFNRDRESFEIDAPRTTVAVQNAGMYRVDAGDKSDAPIRVSVTDGGQARVYSENSGFSLRSGRTAQIQIAGNYAGEWETSDAAKYADEFDAWTLQRDAIVAKRLQNAYYDKYYDTDAYGAEDLSEYGEWIYTKKYGYVWKPYRNATSSYANWSPYRYGNWRWIPPYGWTWVNDEPWGYATYHHGRWVYADSDWVWTPYGHYRSNRNRWRPALVVVNYVGSLICWYPLPYDYGYYNYNSVYVDRRRYNTTVVNNNNTTVIVNPTQNTTSGRREKTFERKPIEFDVPPSGVVAVQTSDFGRGTKTILTAPVEAAKKTLSKTPFEIENSQPLPNYQELRGSLSGIILPENQRNERVKTEIKTGATERKSGVAVDEILRKERVYGNRAPLERTLPTAEAKENQGRPETRETGAVKRVLLPMTRQDADEGIRKSSKREIQRREFPARSKSGVTNDESGDNPVSKPRNKVREIAPPVSAPPEQEERQERRERQQIPPQREAQPRSEPPPEKREEPREAKPPQREKETLKEERKVSPPPSPPREKSEIDKPEKDN